MNKKDFLRRVALVIIIIGLVTLGSLALYVAFMNFMVAVEEEKGNGYLEFRVENLTGYEVIRFLETPENVSEYCGQYFPLVVEDPFHNNTFYYDENYSLHQGLTPKYRGDRMVEDCVLIKFTPKYKGFAIQGEGA